MEDFGGKSLPEHLSGGVTEKGDKKKRIATFFLSPFLGWPVLTFCFPFQGRQYGLYFLSRRCLFFDTQQFYFEYQCRERFDL